MINNQLKNAVDKWSNSFLRPLIPPKLLSNSEIKGTEDDGAKLIYLKFLYGIRTGRFSERPTDGGINNVISNINEESLWIYSLRNEEIPEGFKPLKKKDSGIIGTGDIRKCSTCRGQGRVRCKSCGGKVRWTSKDFEGKRIDNVCSCGDGKQMCGSCDGFGDVEVIILTQREFKLFDTKNSQYTGEVPKDKIKKITGDLIYEQIYDYPLDMVREMLIGGIDTNEFNQLNNAVLEHLKQSIDDQLKERGDIDTSKIHSQLDTLFNTIPNPGKENKVLEHESMPIRVMVRVENAPVKQIDYNYKEKDYSIWVYGKENSVWKQKSPSSFNYKGIILSILLLALIGAGIFFYLDNNRSYKTNYNQNKNTSNITNKNLNNSDGFNNSESAIITDPDGFTNVRSGKGTNTNVIYKLKSNEKFTVFPTNEKWWKVKLTNDQNGYIFHNRVKIIKYGTINGNDVIIRDGHSTQSKIIGSFKNLGERVNILDSYYPSNNGETLIQREINVRTNIGTNYNLQKGKSVTILSRQNGNVKIHFKNKELKNLTATINESYLDKSVNSKWYKVKRNNGEIGWVFGKFINL
jgi:uncharacterized protein YgiM (DUF1202 family)